MNTTRKQQQGRLTARATRRACLVCVASVAVVTLQPLDHAEACSGGGLPGQDQQYTGLIARASLIVLARFVAHDGLPPDPEGFPIARYAAKFEAIEVLRGPVNPTFSVIFQGAHPEAFVDVPDADFDGHKSEEFWNRRYSVGRRAFAEGTGGLCALSFVFERGGTYLAILDEPHNVRAFERIRRDDDQWLHVVRALANGEGMSARGFLSEQSVVAMGTINACEAENDGRFDVRVEEYLVGEGPWHMSLPGTLYEPSNPWAPPEPCEAGQTLLMVGNGPKKHRTHQLYRVLQHVRQRKRGKPAGALHAATDLAFDRIVAFEHPMRHGRVWSEWSQVSLGYLRMMAEDLRR